jgi:hypothetical protein
MADMYERVESHGVVFPGWIHKGDSKRVLNAKPLDGEIMLRRANVLTNAGNCQSAVKGVKFKVDVSGG